jgi:hypothetical protein
MPSQPADLARMVSALLEEHCGYAAVQAALAQRLKVSAAPPGRCRRRRGAVQRGQLLITTPYSQPWCGVVLFQHARAALPAWLQDEAPDVATSLLPGVGQIPPDADAGWWQAEKRRLVEASMASTCMPVCRGSGQRAFQQPTCQAVCVLLPCARMAPPGICATPGSWVPPCRAGEGGAEGVAAARWHGHRAALVGGVPTQPAGVLRG